MYDRHNCRVVRNKGLIPHVSKTELIPIQYPCLRWISSAASQLYLSTYLMICSVTIGGFTVGQQSWRESWLTLPWHTLNSRKHKVGMIYAPFRMQMMAYFGCVRSERWSLAQSWDQEGTWIKIPDQVPVGWFSCQAAKKKFNITNFQSRRTQTLLRQLPGCISLDILGLSTHIEAKN